MSITVVNHIDQELVNQIAERASTRTRAASADAGQADFASVLAKQMPSSTQTAASARTVPGVAGSDTVISENAPILQGNTRSALQENAAQNTVSAAPSALQNGISKYNAHQTANSPASLESIFQTAANTYHVSVGLLKSIARAESNFNPNAVSRSGAVGIMQLMPKTAASLGVSNSYDPAQNIMGGAKYISQLLAKYQGNVSLALAAYNAGSGNVAKYGGIPPFKETQDYVKKVTSYMEEFGASAPTAPSSAFHLSGEARTKANQMLEQFFSSKRISKEALDLLNVLLKIKSYADSVSSAGTPYNPTLSAENNVSAPAISNESSAPAVSNENEASASAVSKDNEPSVSDVQTDKEDSEQPTPELAHMASVSTEETEQSNDTEIKLDPEMIRRA